MPATATKPKTTAPRTLADFPAYAAAQDKLARLEADRRELLAKQQDLAQEMGDADVHKQRLHERARNLLEGREAENVDVRAESERLADRLEVLAAAIEMQKQAVAGERSAAAAEIRADLVPQCQALNRRIAAALQSLRDALDAEEQFVRAVEAEQIGFGYPLNFEAFRFGNLARPDAVEVLDTILANYHNR